MMCQVGLGHAVSVLPSKSIAAIFGASFVPRARDASPLDNQ
jgi:hypothetical protein